MKIIRRIGVVYILALLALGILYYQFRELNKSLESLLEALEPVVEQAVDQTVETVEHSP